MALPLWRGGLCREVRIRVNLWAVHHDRKDGRCREVAVSGGSTVYFIAMVVTTFKAKETFFETSELWFTRVTKPHGGNKPKLRLGKIAADFERRPSILG